MQYCCLYLLHCNAYNQADDHKMKVNSAVILLKVLLLEVDQQNKLFSSSKLLYEVEQKHVLFMQVIFEITSASSAVVVRYSKYIRYLYM